MPVGLTLFASSLLIISALPAARAQSAATSATPRDYLANNTVLIIRHSEKPLSGNDLAPRGVARAQAYARYFEPFHEDGFRFSVDALYAGADSDNSIRPRRTLEPLSQATGMKLNLASNPKDPAQLVRQLRSEAHGTHPLIAWRHGQIPALLSAFGASRTLLPDGKWPDDTYDWVIVLSFDATGGLQSAQRLSEHLTLPVH